MFINRQIAREIKEAAGQMPVISITGPRQSGKTTLARALFPDYKYVNLEDIEQRDFALADPKGFLQTTGERAIIDEIQYVPELFSYIQIRADETDKKGIYILTGSQNFLLREKISQTLAGRVAIFNLLPLSVAELDEYGLVTDDPESLMHKGFYPRLYSSKINYSNWLNDYIQTYIERDVRQIVNVGDLNSFRQFIKVCAARSGQLINLSEIGNDISVSYKTVKRWLSILEASYIIFTVMPYYKNFNKRIIKSSKIYFYDTGVACNLLNIRNPSDLSFHYLRGGIFEGFILSEFKKYMLNHKIPGEIYFFRDSAGNEVDAIIEANGKFIPVEIKAGKTIKPEFFKGLLYLKNLLKLTELQDFVIYGGDTTQKRANTTVYGWKNANKVLYQF
ncbi:MAG: ATPase [bacterium]|nr:MAG: ATPase [bacterium]